MELSYYGDAISAFYDAMYPPHDVPAILTHLRDLIPAPASVVDFGVGTGRTAIPMAQQGYTVHGIDASASMLTVLREKDPEGLVTTTQQDFIDVGAAEHDVCVMLNSTLFMAPSHERRQATFHAAARQLRSGGLLLVDTYSPLPYLRGPEAQHSFAPLGLGTSMYFDKIVVDAYAQSLVILRTFVTTEGMSTMVEESHFALPGELDLLAAAAGFELDSRWGGWAKQEATAQSTSYVSLYRRKA